MTALKRIVPWLVAATLLLAVHYMHLAADRTRAAMPKLQRFALLPDGSTLRTMTLGFQNVIADFLWLRSVQAIGDRQVSKEAGMWIFRAIDIVTTLDPRFVAAYEAGGIALCTVVVMPEESNRILEKGMRNNPEEWRLPFMLGINYYFELGDDAKAAEYIAIAASVGGGPEYLASFASRLYMTAKDPQKAVEVLATSYEHSSDTRLREFLGFRLKEALVERDIQSLRGSNRAISSPIWGTSTEAGGIGDCRISGRAAS